MGLLGSVVGQEAGAGLGSLIGRRIGGRAGAQAGANIGRAGGGLAGGLLPFKYGGAVPGKEGQAIMVMAHGGEYVLPVGVKPTKAQMAAVDLSLRTTKQGNRLAGVRELAKEIKKELVAAAPKRMKKEKPAPKLTKSGAPRKARKDKGVKRGAKMA